MTITWTHVKRTLGQLKPWADNPRFSTKKQARALLRSWDELGQFQTIAISPTDEVYDGHQRLSALLTVNGTDYEIDAMQSSRPLTDEEHRRLVIAAHIGAVGSWDWDKLAAWDTSALIEWGMDADALSAWQTDAGQLAVMLDADKPAPVEDVEPAIDRAEELREKWGVEPGQLWRLGEHRLICGDCTDRAVVERVMDGEGFDLCVTSPPYNSGDGGYKADYNGPTSKFYKRDGTDDRTEQEWVGFCVDVLNVSALFTASDESVIAWNVMYTARSRKGYGESMFSGRHPFTVKETICWDKCGSGFPSATRGILSRNWEFVFILSKGETYNTTQGEHETRWCRWEIERPRSQHEQHHATFPQELVERAINDFGGSIVYEPFSGSGTTLIACERMGRKCRAIEIDPGYVAVALERWSVATGKTPELING